MCQSQAWGVGQGPHGARPGSDWGREGCSGSRLVVRTRVGLEKGGKRGERELNGSWAVRHWWASWERGQGPDLLCSKLGLLTSLTYHQGTSTWLRWFREVVNKSNTWHHVSPQVLARVKGPRTV